MESTDVGVERLMPQIGPNHQVTMPPLKYSARIASLEFINRDQWYGCGLPVPIMRIASSSLLPRKCSSAADQEDKSLSLASTSNSRSQPHESSHMTAQKIVCKLGSSKDANSCASSTKETCLTLKKDFDVFQQEGGCQSKQQAAEDAQTGGSGQSELKSSVSAVQGSCAVKKRKKRRSCWQPLKRKGNKKARKDKRWSSGSLQSEVVQEGAAAAEAPQLLPETHFKFTTFPGSAHDTWNDGEVAAFTLALYLFDKDFCAIKRFLETKKMKDIVHYYYGKFYASPAFCRWAGSKNNRSRKCVHGPRILQGWRQEELLRRLLPRVPEKSKDEISEAVKAFNERERTVEGLVSELKAAVGLEVLVECVGIGVAKRDLTAVHAEPGNGTHHSMEIPTGKMSSSLSKQDILEHLSGESRIGKARAQELFWEAVWPRLLANGWHSKECKSTTTLVFLRPGVKKIHKGISEKGVDYFVTVSEVLKAVANDPCLIDAPELTGDTVDDSENQDDEDGRGWSDDMFETLDTQLRGSHSSKTQEGKTRAVLLKTLPTLRPAEESSESSSVDIDLNRTLSAGNSKPFLAQVQLFDRAVRRSNAETKGVAAPDVLDCTTEDAHLKSPERKREEDAPERYDCTLGDANPKTPDTEEGSALEVVGRTLIDVNFQPEGEEDDDTPAHLDCTPSDPNPSTTQETEAENAVNVKASSVLFSVEINTGSLLGEIDLNQPPVDSDYVFEAPFSAEENGDWRFKPWDCAPSPHAIPVDQAADIVSAPQVIDTHVLGTLDLNDPPVPPLDAEDIERGIFAQRDVEEQQQRGVVVATTIEVSPSHWCVQTPIEDLKVFGCRMVSDKPQSHKLSCLCGLEDTCKCQSRKRLQRYQECHLTERGWVGNGMELISLPKRRAIRMEIPFGLGAFACESEARPNFFITLETQVARMCSLSTSGLQTLAGEENWMQNLSTRNSVTIVPFQLSQRVLDTEVQQPKCRVVEVDKNLEPVDVESNDAKHQDGVGNVSQAVSTVAVLPTRCRNRKNLRCNVTDRGGGPALSFSRSKLQRVPRKFTILFDSRSTKNVVTGTQERHPPWASSQGQRDVSSVGESLNSCLTTDGTPGTDTRAYGSVYEEEELQRTDGANCEVLDAGQPKIKSEECDEQMSPSCSGRTWRNTFETLGAEQESSFSDQMENEKPFARDCKPTHTSFTSPGDPCDSYQHQEVCHLASGFEINGTSQSLPVKSYCKYYLNFGINKKRIPVELQLTEVSKRIKVDGSYSLRSRDSSEQDSGPESCSQGRSAVDRTTLTEGFILKVTGKRSPRIRRRNFAFLQFLFAHTEEVEEGMCVQPCSSQGPWQPSSYLPPNERVLKPSKLRRRRSSLPCKRPCASTTPAAPKGSTTPGAKGTATSKAQTGHRLSGQNVVNGEAAATLLKRPQHDVRFSLRRAVSEGSILKPERPNGRKVAARWQKSPVC